MESVYQLEFIDNGVIISVDDIKYAALTENNSPEEMLGNFIFNDVLLANEKSLSDKITITIKIEPLK